MKLKNKCRHWHCLCTVVHCSKAIYRLFSAILNHHFNKRSSIVHVGISHCAKYRKNWLAIVWEMLIIRLKSPIPQLWEKWKSESVRYWITTKSEWVLQLVGKIISAVTIIVVTIFIAIFQNYHFISLLRYFLCVRNDIFARHLCYASMIDSPPVYSSFSTLQSRAANDVTRDCRPATVAEQRLRLWKTPQLPLKYRVAGGLCDPSRLYDVTTHN